MSTRKLRRVIWLLAVMVIATPMVLPLSAKNKSTVADVEEQTESPELANIINHIILSENRYNVKVLGYSPRVETYVQYYESGRDSSDVVKNDAIFLGRLKFDKLEREVSFIEDSGPSFNLLRHSPGFTHPQIHLNYFAVELLTVDATSFDRQHYTFEPVRWEYLGDVRCLAVDVHPREPAEEGAFKGRIWVEDHDYAIVRLNGTRVHPPHRGFYVHFDCWRKNLQPGQWLPVYVYSEETGLGHESGPGKHLRYKAETRLWGYDLTARREQQEWTTIQVEAPEAVRDNSERADFSPVESRRQWNMEAEHNVLDRLEKARLIAPPGPVDHVLETVVNNLRVTNHLDNLPPIQCRVMETSSLESFSLAYTIVVSRGLLDVLPDESSLAMMLSHELAHIALGHKLDTKYAFNDRLEVTDEDLLASLDLMRSSQDEAAADIKGLEFLKNSPYKDKLDQAGLFLRAAVDAAPHCPHLFGAHLGNGLTQGKLIRMGVLADSAPALDAKDVSQVAALPLGSRVQVNPWDGSVAFTDRHAVALVDASEKLAFRVTPIVPYLQRLELPQKVDVSASVSTTNGSGN